MKVFAMMAGILGAIGVAAGAFGAHGLEGKVEPRLLEVFETAARYQMYHALALLGVAWIAGQTQSTAASVAGWSFIIGVLIFSGSLYLMTFTGMRWLGAITPIGGTALIVGWIALVFAAVRL